MKLCKGSPSTNSEHGMRDDVMITGKEKKTKWGNVKDIVVVAMD